MSDRQKFRYVRPGTGGTLKFGKKDINLVGTTDCDMSLGVYFNVDSERAFCANIQFKSNNGKLGKLSEEQGKTLTEQIVNKLIQCGAEDAWNLDSEWFGTGAVIVCRQPESVSSTGKQQKHAGKYAIEALQSFFRVAIHRIQAQKLSFSADEERWQQKEYGQRQEPDKSEAIAKDPYTTTGIDGKIFWKAKTPEVKPQDYARPPSSKQASITANESKQAGHLRPEDKDFLQKMKIASEQSSALRSSGILHDDSMRNRRNHMEFLSGMVGKLNARMDCNGFILDQTGHHNPSFFGMNDESGNAADSSKYVKQAESLSKWEF